MKKINKIAIKQSIKYFLIFLLFIIGIGIYRIMWDITDKLFYSIIIFSVIILVVMAIFDLITIKDIISIFKN